MTYSGVDESITATHGKLDQSFNKRQSWTYICGIILLWEQDINEYGSVFGMKSSRKISIGVLSVPMKIYFSEEEGDSRKYGRILQALPRNPPFLNYYAFVPQKPQSGYSLLGPRILG